MKTRTKNKSTKKKFLEKIQKEFPNAKIIFKKSETENSVREFFIFVFLISLFLFAFFYFRILFFLFSRFSFRLF